MPATCWAILPASNEFIAPFCPPTFAGLTVYAPAPNPPSEYCPASGPIPPEVVITFGDPAPERVTFETNRGVGDPPGFPYVTVPEIIALTAEMLPFSVELAGLPSFNVHAG